MHLKLFFNAINRPKFAWYIWMKTEKYISLNSKEILSKNLKDKICYILFYFLRVKKKFSLIVFCQAVHRFLLNKEKKKMMWAQITIDQTQLLISVEIYKNFSIRTFFQETSLSGPLAVYNIFLLLFLSSIYLLYSLHKAMLTISHNLKCKESPSKKDLCFILFFLLKQYFIF